VAIVGAEESYPMLGNVKSDRPAVRPAVLPDHADVPVARAAGPGAAAEQVADRVRQADRTSHLVDDGDDPLVVFNLADQVRETIQQSLYELLDRRPDPFS
jgi:hypothetical protein